jgi:Leucine-rich repeat (LRR) protein
MELGGTLPSEIGSLRLLTSLDIDNGTFSGTLPEALFLLTALETLDINNNQFTGSISSSIGQLTNLKVLQIDSNGFAGTVPPELMQLESLSKSSAAMISCFLMITGYELTITIPSNPISVLHCSRFTIDGANPSLLRRENRLASSGGWGE